MSTVHCSQLDYGAGQSSTASSVHSTLMWSACEFTSVPMGAQTVCKH